jgi:hypothetical protein
MARNKLVSASRTYYVARRERSGRAVNAVFAGLATSEPGPSSRLEWKDVLHQVRRRLGDDERRLADRRPPRSSTSFQSSWQASAMRRSLASIFNFWR